MIKRSPERAQFLSDITITAVESDACGYWANVTDYDNRKDDDVTALFIERDTGALRIIGNDVIANGVGKIVRGEVQIAARLRKMVADANVDNDACDIDSELADCIVQAAMLNELRYG